jgi:hypothetical protein
VESPTYNDPRLAHSPRDPCNSGPAGLPQLRAVADNAAMEAEPIKTEPAKHKRRWFQFSLRHCWAWPSQQHD